MNQCRAEEKNIFVSVVDEYGCPRFWCGLLQNKFRSGLWSPKWAYLTKNGNGSDPKFFAHYSLIT